jgi:hypothetical protein
MSRNNYAVPLEEICPGCETGKYAALARLGMGLLEYAYSQQQLQVDGTGVADPTIVAFDTLLDANYCGAVFRQAVHGEGWQTHETVKVFGTPQSLAISLR